MLIFILIPLIIARVKGYRVLQLFKVIDMYPFFFVCACHGFFILNAWNDNHSFVRYAKLLQFLLIFTLILPIVRRRITTPALVGVGMTMAGTVMNTIVINANGGKMPVYPTISKWIWFYKAGQLDPGAIDDLHILMDSSTKLPFLADYFDFGTCISSPGDMLVHSFASIIIYYTIKAVCDRDLSKIKSANK